MSKYIHSCKIFNQVFKLDLASKQAHRSCMQSLDVHDSLCARLESFMQMISHLTNNIHQI